MNCLIRIRQRYAGFAQSDKKLADFLLSQPDHARHLSSQQLAQEAGVSQSSVVKFAQKIGYKGFPALKLAISEALASHPNPQSMPVHNQIRGDDPMRLVGEKLIKEKVAAMHATLDVNTEEKLLESVAMLRTARRVILTGIGASGLVARNFGWKLNKIGLTAIVEQDMHALLATVQAMEPNDVLLALSYSGERREINLAADEALRAGGKILAITGFTPNALQQRATRCLYTIAEEQATRSAAISSTSAQMLLTDLMFMALVQQDLEHAPDRIRHSEADAELLSKAQSGRADEINTCIGCNQACLDQIFVGKVTSCLVNPRACHETKMPVVPAVNKKRLAVVGAGPAGLAFAVNAASRGHSVTLFDALAEIGGQFNIAKQIPGKEEFYETLRYYRRMIELTGVELRLNQFVRAADLIGFDEVILVVLAGRM
jgi:DNA-binding MurR/RpiR family transcriptional regulator